ncbi:MAG: serine hydrolase domain-containing protein [Sphingopyxis sp.]|jgi:CubicO group peptidase (beta-lactamase class C family)|uniref:serine hydrolase domain-containing protein n=1 Tax=Sphingopyxis sp. TaxID=1908224 RepID=UPI003F70E4A1
MRGKRLALAMMMASAGLAASTPPLHAQVAPREVVTIDKARIDAALKAMIADGRGAGTSALIWQDGREVYFGSAGMADREAKRPMRRDTIAQIYSMTKPVTGVALMQLWEAGKFHLDDPLAKYLPEYANMRVYAGKDAAGQPRYVAADRPITVRDILRHTAGFAYGAGPTPAHDAYVAAEPLALTIPLAEASKRLAGVPLLYQPGTQWEYSIAVDVQAALVEKLSGQPFAAYVRAHIFEPLKMRETAWRQPDARLPRFAAMNVKKDGKLVQQAAAEAQVLNFRDHALTPGGFGLASTLDDYQRFARMLLNKGELDGVRILKPSTVKLMATDQLDPAITERAWLPGKGHVGFGFDFAVRNGQPLTAEESRGATGEYFWDGMASTLFWVDPANRLTAVFFVQTIPYDGTLHRDFRAAVYGPDYRGPAGD